VGVQAFVQCLLVEINSIFAVSLVIWLIGWFTTYPVQVGAVPLEGSTTNGLRNLLCNGLRFASFCALAATDHSFVLHGRDGAVQALTCHLLTSMAFMKSRGALFIH
jgi:hypothetical protein